MADNNTLWGFEPGPDNKGRKMPKRVKADDQPKRYYLHKQLDRKLFNVIAQKKVIETTYKRFAAIPAGQDKYVLNQLFKYGYSIYYGVPPSLMPAIKIRKKKS